MAGLYGVWKIIAGPEGVWLAGQFTQIGGVSRRASRSCPTPLPSRRTNGSSSTGSAPGATGRVRPPRGGRPAPSPTRWASGRGEIGFGDGDENTRIAATRTLYARRSFTVANRSAWRILHLRVLADAGAAVYLNGVEVARDNLPTGPLTAGTQALGAKWTRAERAVPSRSQVPAARGWSTARNVLAVEVHTRGEPRGHEPRGRTPR